MAGDLAEILVHGWKEMIEPLSEGCVILIVSVNVVLEKNDGMCEFSLVSGNCQGQSEG
jgi:hypothetical protein